MRDIMTCPWYISVQYDVGNTHVDHIDIHDLLCLGFSSGLSCLEWTAWKKRDKLYRQNTTVIRVNTHLIYHAVHGQ